VTLMLKVKTPMAARLLRVGRTAGLSLVGYLAAANGPRISCGDFLTAHYLTFLRPEAPVSCMRLLDRSLR
jgi:hypothetical protein